MIRVHAEQDAYLSQLRARLAARDRGAWALVVSVAAGLLVGLLITIFRDVLLPEQFGRDALKIWRISSGREPDFADRSFTPVATVYRLIGVGDAPVAAGILSFAFAAVTLVVAIRASRRLAATPLAALYIFFSLIVTAIFLGQYSKDVFVFPVILLLVLLPGRLVWEIAAVAAMGAYALWFRPYWGIVLVVYIAYRLATLRQVRLRYLLMGGAVTAALVGLAFTVALGLDPNHFRANVHETQHTDVNTILIPLEPFVQPWGGLVDVFAAYWLILAPVTLPFSAGVLYTSVVIGFICVRLVPLWQHRSANEWPRSEGRDGVLVRRSLSLILAYGAVQALFEPDYGSVIRHLSPLLPLMIILILIPSTNRATSRHPKEGRQRG